MYYKEIKTGFLPEYFLSENVFTSYLHKFINIKYEVWLNNAKEFRSCINNANAVQYRNSLCFVV